MQTQSLPEHLTEWYDFIHSSHNENPTEGFDMLYCMMKASLLKGCYPVSFNASDHMSKEDRERWNTKFDQDVTVEFNSNPYRSNEMDKLAEALGRRFVNNEENKTGNGDVHS